MARRRTDRGLLLIASAIVITIAGGMVLTALHCLRAHPAAQGPAPPESPSTDAAVMPMPDMLGTRCGGPVVKLVRAHPSTKDGESVEAEADRRLRAKAKAEDALLLKHGWRGREDRERPIYCRVSLRYQLGKARGATVWLINPDEPSHARIEPQDLLSVEVTKALPWPDANQEATFQKKCAVAGVERVKKHFSFMENYNLWRCLRKRAIVVRRDTGVEIVYGHWGGKAEAPGRCITWVDYTEDEVEKTAYFRLIYIDDEEDYAIEPLTPRATEAIYGPGVFTR